MTTNARFRGDVGAIIRMNCGTDISTCDPLEIKVLKPDGKVSIWTGTLYGTNYIDYTLQERDLDQAGRYVLQPVIYRYGIRIYGPKANMDVDAPLDWRAWVDGKTSNMVFTCNEGAAGVE